MADHACKAMERRLVADPARLDAVAGWTARPSEVGPPRRACVATLPWSRQRRPRCRPRPPPRERILGWAAGYVADRGNSGIQKAVGWWLRTLSLRRPRPRPRSFLDGPGRDLRPFARREALRRT